MKSALPAASNILSTRHGNVLLPAFFPDATHGAVRAADMTDVENCGVQGLVMNAYHLYNNPGAALIKSLGGLSKFTGWRRPILTDSGGFQLFSLIRENEKYGEIRDNEIVFRPDSGGKLIYTPEKCIQAQLRYGSDIIMALDVCTHPDDSLSVQERSVDLTIKWAERCRTEFDRAQTQNSNKPLLFGIIQGGRHEHLRKKCAEALVQIGFDGFGFGGWPLDNSGKLLYDILALTANLMPEGKVKYAMGLGRPDEIVKLHAAGYTLFDCVIPTREARHHRLYIMDEVRYGSLDGAFFKHYYALDDKYCRDESPVSRMCRCILCKNYSRAYLHHLCKNGDSQAMRLMTIHNLWFYNDLMQQIRENMQC